MLFTLDMERFSSSMELWTTSYSVDLGIQPNNAIMLLEVYIILFCISDDKIPEVLTRFSQEVILKKSTTFNFTKMHTASYILYWL